MTRTCSNCFRDATWRSDGKYRNGREATDWKCDDHRPGTGLSRNYAIGSWAFMGNTATMYRIETVERTRVEGPTE